MNSCVFVASAIGIYMPHDTTHKERGREEILNEPKFDSAVCVS